MVVVLGSDGLVVVFILILELVVVVVGQQWWLEYECCGMSGCCSDVNLQG